MSNLPTYLKQTPFNFMKGAGEKQTEVFAVIVYYTAVNMLLNWSWEQ